MGKSYAESLRVAYAITNATCTCATHLLTRAATGALTTAPLNRKVELKPAQLTLGYPHENGYSVTVVQPPAEKANEGYGLCSMSQPRIQGREVLLKDPYLEVLLHEIYIYIYMLLLSQPC